MSQRTAAAAAHGRGSRWQDYDPQSPSRGGRRGRGSTRTVGWARQGAACAAGAPRRNDDRARRRPGAGRPCRHRRLRGLERRRRGGHGGRVTTSSTSGTPSRSPPSTPRTTTTSRSTGRASSSTTAAAGSTGARPGSSSPTAPRPGRDVILVQGIEPSFRWRAFTIELMEFAQQVGATAVFTLGALMADVAHTRPIPVTATSDDDDVIHRFDLEPSRYEGPTGIVGVLADAATQSGLQSISCWAAVPHYAGHSPSPKATLALVSRLEELLDTHHPARRPRRRGQGVGARHQRARRHRRGGRRVRPVARGGAGHRRPARGQRRRDRPGVRALPAPSGPGGPRLGRR